MSLEYNLVKRKQILLLWRQDAAAILPVDTAVVFTFDLLYVCGFGVFINVLAKHTGAALIPPEHEMGRSPALENTEMV